MWVWGLSRDLLLDSMNGGTRTATFNSNSDRIGTQALRGNNDAKMDDCTEPDEDAVNQNYLFSVIESLAHREDLKFKQTFLLL